MNKMIRIGTRKSALAMVQTELVAEALKRVQPGLLVETVTKVTEGDRILNKPLLEFGGKGVFVTEFEQALLKGEIDFAVHSAKDLPMDLEDGLGIVAVPPREDPRDVLMTPAGTDLSAKKEIVIGTSSLRRRLQIEALGKKLWPGSVVRCEDIRGNIQTRIRKMDEGLYDAIILAAAGLKRMNMVNPPADGLEEYFETNGRTGNSGRGGADRGQDLRAGSAHPGRGGEDVPHTGEEDLKAAGCGLSRTDRRVLQNQGRTDRSIWNQQAERRNEACVSGRRDRGAGSSCGTRGERTEIEMKETGKVFLVGAGPGDPGLITEKGLKRLRECDVVVYDHLASERFLDEVPEESQRIYVGKKAGCHYMKQEEINQLLVDLAREGKNVVRLKGGDPFVFGRGGEEVMAVSREGIPFEVVSGVTSAVAALASAGIPVTHRAVSRSFHIMTGHTMTEAGKLPLDFSEFAKLSGTLIFLMGLSHLPLIVKGLMENGKPGSTPAAVIEKGTLPGQRVVRGTLDTMEQRVAEEGIGTPAIIVVGEVTALDFASTYHEPLEGARVAVTGTDLLAAKLRKSLEEAGAYTECVLSMELESYRSGEAMKTAYERMADYRWIVFTSANAVREFFLGLLESGGDNRRLGHVKFAAVGKGTAKELLRYGFTTDYTPEEYCAAALAEGLKRVVKEGERLLIPRSFKGSPELVEILDSAGIVYDDIVLYDVAERRKGAKEMAESLKKADYLTFASGSGVDAFYENAGEDVTALLDGIRVVCIGDITARKLEEHGRKADVTAASFTVEGMTEAISRDWNRGSEN